MGKRRKFAKFIEMNMQEYTILRYKKICSMFFAFAKFLQIAQSAAKKFRKKGK